ncbi:MAG: hypothetical protein A3J38_05405 [Gammaproteobacteria bacterium RIFCSPHIGHO2_12_FULL_45_9]|nr:MAG: hypothetical protein A3J38_05405 [Gammaproteobacteria bacterium RIFCSPHIGHO2_12_FULL_45_9]
MTTPRTPDSRPATLGDEDVDDDAENKAEAGELGPKDDRLGELAAPLPPDETPGEFAGRAKKEEEKKPEAGKLPETQFFNKIYVREQYRTRGPITITEAFQSKLLGTEESGKMQKAAGEMNAARKIWEQAKQAFDNSVPSYVLPILVPEPRRAEKERLGQAVDAAARECRAKYEAYETFFSRFQEAFYIELMRIKEGKSLGAGTPYTAEQTAKKALEDARRADTAAQTAATTSPQSAEKDGAAAKTKAALELAKAAHEAATKALDEFKSKAKNYRDSAAGSLACEIIKRTAAVDDAEAKAKTAPEGAERTAAEKALERAKLNLTVFFSAATASLTKRLKDIDTTVEKLQETLPSRAERLKDTFTTDSAAETRQKEINKLLAEKQEIERLQNEIRDLKSKDNYKSHYVAQFADSLVVEENQAKQKLAELLGESPTADTQISLMLSGRGGFYGVGDFTPGSGKAIVSRTDIGAGAIGWVTQESPDGTSCQCLITPSQKLNGGDTTNATKDYLGLAIKLVEGFREAFNRLPEEIIGKSGNPGFDEKLTHAILFYCHEKYGASLNNFTDYKPEDHAFRNHSLKGEYEKLIDPEESQSHKARQKEQKTAVIKDNVAVEPTETRRSGP